jgi:hypothetical protein
MSSICLFSFVHGWCWTMDQINIYSLMIYGLYIVGDFLYSLIWWLIFFLSRLEQYRLLSFSMNRRVFKFDYLTCHFFFSRQDTWWNRKEKIIISKSSKPLLLFFFVLLDSLHMSVWNRWWRIIWKTPSGSQTIATILKQRQTMSFSL